MEGKDIHKDKGRNLYLDGLGFVVGDFPVFDAVGQLELIWTPNIVPRHVRWPAACS